MQDYQAYPGLKETIHRSTIEANLELLRRNGFFMIENVFDADELSLIREKMDTIWSRQLEKYGADLLSKIGDYGVIRAMMADDPYFFSLILNPTIFKYVAEIIGESAILHLQNGIVLHPTRKHNQARYHKDFPKDFLSTKLLSLNALIVVDEFNDVTGGTWVIPGSHLHVEMPSASFLEKNEIQIKAPAGSVFIFDSHLWHKGGANTSNQVRRAINQQYTRPFIKQQLDYPAFLKDKVDKESKIAQVMGFWSCPPKGTEEYRVSDPSLRTYRANQG